MTSDKIGYGALLLGLGIIFGGCFYRAAAAQWGSDQKQTESVMKAVDALGWKDEFKKGREIMRVLANLRAEKNKTDDVTAFRGTRVAFFGAAAPPGATTDLITEEGFYLRILIKHSKDLRPQATSWTVLVCGNVSQVLSQNRTIVIDAKEKDWVVLDTE
jgi:hypothetical protein